MRKEGSQLLKIIFEYLTDFCSLLENPIQDCIFIEFFGALACMIAYRALGTLYHLGIIERRNSTNQTKALVCLSMRGRKYVI